jgi:hypothetical protein
VHVAELSAHTVTFDRGCHLAQLTMNSFTVKMFGALLIQGRLYPLRVTLTANAICALALALAIIGLLINTLFILLIIV